MRTMTAAFAVAASCAMLAGCDSLPGKPHPGPEVPRPEAVHSATVLFQQNCSGCHGAEGMNGPATPIGSPEYQALVDDATLRGIIANGLPGSMMPPFSVQRNGPLTDSQIDSLVKGIRARWYKGNVLAGLNPPPHTDETPGDSSRGQQVYGSVCANCHGEIGKEVGDAGSIVNGSFLALMAPQSIRTTMIIGRPDLGMPDWRDLDPGKPLSSAQMADVVAFLESKRPAIAGQPYRTAEEPPASSGQDVRTGVHGQQQQAEPLAQPRPTASRRGQQ